MTPGGECLQLKRAPSKNRAIRPLEAENAPASSGRPASSLRPHTVISHLIKRRISGVGMNPKTTDFRVHE